MSGDSKDNSVKPQSGSIPWAYIYVSVLIFTVIAVVLLYTFSEFYSG